MKILDFETAKKLLGFGLTEPKADGAVSTSAIEANTPNDGLVTRAEYQDRRSAEYGEMTWEEVREAYADEIERAGLGAPDKGKRRITNFPDFHFSIERDGKEIEIDLEVIDFQPAGREGNGEYLGAYVEFGEAFLHDLPTLIALTKEELEQADEQFGRMLQ